MKTKSICLFALALLAGLALAAPDSLACRMIDWLDVPGSTMRYGSTGDGEYNYLGTCLWDMAIGDSFLVWLPGTDRTIFVKTTNQTAIETTYCDFYSSENIKGCAVKDSMFYLCGGGLIWSLIYGTDSIALGDYELVDPWASFHYAVIRDTFLYTASTGSYGLHCINIANPESIFVAWTNEYYFGFSGLEVVDSVVYSSSASTFYVSPPDDWHSRPHWYLLMADVSGDTCVVHTRVRYFDNEHHCSIASNDENLFFAYNEMSDFIFGVQDFTLGASHLGIWGTDYSYTWAEPYGEPSFGVDVLNERILAVGFEHGFSILDYSDLDDIHEVAYYRDTDSIFAFTHFALKEDRLFAMAHPRDSICRMYMFELPDSVVSGQGEASMPEKFQFWNYPNPFNSSCRFALSGFMEPIRDIEIFDITGRLVDSIPTVNKGRSTATGFREFVWNPKGLPSGLYFARLKAGDVWKTVKVVYLA